MCGEFVFVDVMVEFECCVMFGVDGVLIVDVGLLFVVGWCWCDGMFGLFKFKMVVVIVLCNVVVVVFYVEFGVISINIVLLFMFDDFVVMCVVIGVDVLFDIYIESFDEFGGGMCYCEVLEFVCWFVLVLFKFGLCNVFSLYLYGCYLELVVEVIVCEKVWCV